MSMQSFLWRPNIRRAGFILLACLISLAAGASTLFFASPLIVGGVVVTAAFGIACLQNPTWALYAVIFLSFLPAQFQRHLPNFTILILLFFALLSWFLNAAFQRRRIVWASTTILMGCFLIWGVVTLFWAPGLVLGRQQLVAYAIGFLMLLLLGNEINSLKTLDGLMKVLALSGWVMVLGGMGTVLAGGYEDGTRLQALEMNENGFGIVILVTMTGVLWMQIWAPERQKPLRTFLAVIYILLALGLVAMSGSRGSAISLLLTVLFLWLWKSTRRWGNLALLILVVASVSAPFMFATTLGRLVEQEGGLLGGRQVIWQAAWQFIRDHPWGGAGIGNGLTEVMPYFRSTRFIWEERMSMHNPPLAVWVETGLPGILLYLGVLGSACWRFLREYFLRRRLGLRSLTPYFALVSSVFIGYMFSWIKGGQMENNFAYFLLLALLLVPSQLEKEELEADEDNEIGRARPGAIPLDQRPGLPS